MLNYGACDCEFVGVTAGAVGDRGGGGDGGGGDGGGGGDEGFEDGVLWDR